MPPTSPNTVRVTHKDSHALSSSHMKLHLQCAEQQAFASNLTKYCACHTERLTCFILITYETSFTMRGATGLCLQPHQNTVPVTQKDSHALSSSHMKPRLRCAQQQAFASNLTKDCACHTERLTCLLSSSHMKPHLQCAEQQAFASNLTKYFACHTERLTCFILITYETSFTMRGATGLCLQPHQIMCLSHRMSHMLYPHHK